MYFAVVLCWWFGGGVRGGDGEQTEIQQVDGDKHSIYKRILSELMGTSPLQFPLPARPDTADSSLA